ncbi:hypothetical protein ACIRP2_24285 [Streptomyces sp. NPDC101194]|uniref:hypothetical protein n=1 Tax=Streptomyces sp. NPDC101194 TaxID=3366127 RepID=UPI0038038139
MYAPGHAPTPRRVPGRAWIVSMRVLFVLLPVCSFGMLLWSPLLRLAIVRRRTSDWWLTGAGFVFVLVSLMILGRDGSDEPVGIDNVLIPLLLLVTVAAVAYYLVGDVRHHEQPAERDLMGGYAPPAPGYAYASTTPMRTPAPGPFPTPAPAPGPFPTDAPAPAPAPVPAPAPAPGPFPTDAPAPAPAPAPVPAPAPAPAPAATPTDTPAQRFPTSDRAPHRHERIDQVRAELDELSDYLRKEEGR